MAAHRFCVCKNGGDCVVSIIAVAVSKAQAIAFVTVLQSAGCCYWCVGMICSRLLQQQYLKRWQQRLLRCCNLLAVVIGAMG